MKKFASLLLAAITILPAVALGADKPFSLGVGFEFATGKYGTDTRTNSVTVPVTFSYYPTERLDLGLEIPYLYQSNSVTTAAGSMLRFNTRGSRTTARRTAFDQTQSQSGIGDLTLSGGYVVVEEGDATPQVRPTAYVKFPTADKDKGLGTGKFDEGVGLELSKWIGPWYASIEGDYNFIGGSSDLGLKNYFSYQAGLGYRLTDKLRPSLILKGAESPSDNSPALLEGRLKLACRMTDAAGLSAYLAKGLANGSPDFGAGVALSFDF